MNAEWRHKNEISIWLGSRFRYGPVASIRIDLRPFYDGRDNSICGNYTEADAKRIASRFRNEANQRFYGKKARRFGKDAGLRMVSVFHTKPHLHLHILCELPPPTNPNSDGTDFFEEERFGYLTDFVEEFCEKHRMISGEC